MPHGDNNTLLVTSGLLLLTTVYLLVRLLMAKWSIKRLNYTIGRVTKELETVQIDSQVAIKQAEEKLIDKAFIAERENSRKALLDQEEDMRRAYQAKLDNYKTELANLRRIIDVNNGTHAEMIEHLTMLEKTIVVHEVALSTRQFTYEDPASYQEAIRKLEETMKAMIKDNVAATHMGLVSVDGVSDRATEAMMKNLTKIALRAFNGECDAAIARVTHSNLEAMEERIRKSESAIEKILEKWGVHISNPYRDLRIKELRLTYEQEVVKDRIKTEQRALREQMREEERAQREAEQAEREAEREERKIVEALAKAKAEMAAVHTADMTAQLSKIQELEAKLAAAEDKRQRAISMAQQTKCGRVYIISNIGSFGEGVFKIGMTRRQDPMDRIWELSDASVPFDFDVHGMILSEDAPALEAALHRRFTDQRINLVNERKEYFRVGITEIQKACKDLSLDIQLTMLAEAHEWRESEAIRANRKTTPAN